ncbi:MAG: GDP-mannose 4,6-dehydratase, partial [Anaerolineae bacterium]|nr:GDP-mannose 4,6-dehydratase [Anaerolineae bacterium]
MKTALVTGITGQDGSYLAELLLEKGYKVVGMARRSSTVNFERIEHLLDDIIVEQGDLHDQGSLLALLEEHKPSEVYNLAAQSFVPASWNQAVLTAEVTALGVTRMLEAIRLFDKNIRFYQASSSEMFGKVMEVPQKEDTPFYPRSPYGVAKVYGHWITINYRESYDIFATSGILFNHESPRRSLHFVTRKVTMAVACIKCGVNDPPMNEAGQPLVHDGKVQMGDLDMIRDWGFAKEYVIAMWAMLQQDKPRDYVIATNTAYSIRDLCETAFSHAGLDWKDHVVTDDRFLRPTEIAAS